MKQPSFLPPEVEKKVRAARRLLDRALKTDNSDHLWDFISFAELDLQSALTHLKLLARKRSIVAEALAQAEPGDDSVPLDPAARRKA